VSGVIPPKCLKVIMILISNAEYQRNLRAANPGRSKRYDQNRYDKCARDLVKFAKRLYDTTKGGAKSRFIQWDLTLNDVHQLLIAANGQCHMMTINLNKEKYSGREFADLLEANGITANKNGVPGDTRGFVETSGVRIGVAAETTRGHDERWFRELAERMITLLRA